MPSIEVITFFLLAALAVGSAAGLLFSRNAVHAALFLALNFTVVAVFFLLLGAPFIAMVQVTVYAGAIMVLFLFVIMLLGAEILLGEDVLLPWQRPLALLLGVVFLASMFLAIFASGFGPAYSFINDPALQEFGSPAAIGNSLFVKYLLPFELTSFLLLVAMLGAVVLTRDEKKKVV